MKTNLGQMAKAVRPAANWRAAAEGLAGGAAVGLITLVCFQLRLQLATVTCLYLVVIVLLSLGGSFLSSAAVSFLALGCLAYFFSPPFFSFRVSDPADGLAIAVFLTTAAVITRLVSRVRQLMEEKLRQSEACLAEAQQLSHTGSIGRRVATGEIVWSEETFRIFGYDPATKPTMELFLQRVHPEDAALVKQTMERAARAGGDFDVEYRLLPPDGVIKHVHLVAHSQRGKSVSLGVLGAVMDITERRRAEESLRKAQLHLAHVARLTTVGELTASIAHEVNQPLAAVVTNANACLRWMDREPPNLDEARDAVRRIVRDGNRGSEVIARIRRLLKKEQPARADLNVNEIVQETIALARLELQGVALQTDLTRELPAVTADRVQLQQVLLNLTMNAVEAMRLVTDRPRVLRIQTKFQDNHTVLVTVQDTGVGLSPTGVEHLFEAFHTTKPEGLGMGLSICRSLVEGHGGRLWAEPANGPGATFHFTLPVESAEAT